MSGWDEIRYYAGVVKRRYLSFLIPAAVVAGAGLAVVSKLPTIYSSSAKILVESQQIPADFVQSTVTALAGERIQVIQQRVLTRDTILAIVQKFDLFNHRADLTRSEIVDLVRARISFDQLTVNAGARARQQNQLTVAFQLGFEYENPVAALQVANEIVTLVLNEDIRARTASASETTKFLNDENERLSTELAQVQQQVSDFKLKNSQALPEKLAFNMSLLERNERALDDRAREIRGLEEQRRLLEFERNMRVNTISSPGTADSPSNQVLSRQIEALQSLLAQKSTVLSRNHPDIQSLKQQIDALQKQLAESKPAPVPTSNQSPGDGGLSVETQLADQKIAAIDSSLRLLSEQRSILEKGTSGLREVISRTSEVGSSLAELERREDALQKSNQDMSEKLSKARLGERLELDQQAERFEVIEQPTLPQSPVRPNRTLLMALVAGLAMAGGGGSALTFEILDGRIRRPKDITRKLNEMPLSVIPYIKTRRERLRRSLKITALLIAMTIAVVAVLAAIHVYYAPLDVMLFQFLSVLGV
jgi:polysaccharide biosynthesis transport protein